MRWILPVVLLAASALASALLTADPTGTDGLSGVLGQPAICCRSPSSALKACSTRSVRIQPGESR